MDPSKLESIKNWPALKNIHEVQSFLGLFSYYRHLYVLLQRLHLLCMLFKETCHLSMERKRNCSLKAERKSTLTSSYCVAFVLQCDASDHSISMILMQDGKVVAYESKLLQNAKHSMNVYEQEQLSLVHALLVWKHYLFGASFYMQTNHQSVW